MSETAEAFVAFRATVWDDPALADRLLAIPCRAAFVAAVIAEGAALGFALRASDIESAMRAGEQVFLMQWAPVL